MYFILIMILTFIVVVAFSYCIVSGITFILGVLFHIMVSGKIMQPVHYGEKALYFHNTSEFIGIFVSMEWAEFQVAIKWAGEHGWHQLPLRMIEIPLNTVVGAATTDEQGPIQTRYAFFSTLMFSYLRIAFALGFFGTWALLRPAYRATEFVFRRLLEVEKGPLAWLAFFCAALAKLVEVLLRL